MTDELYQIEFIPIEISFNQLAKKMIKVKEYHDYLAGDIDAEILIKMKKEL